MNPAQRKLHSSVQWVLQVQQVAPKFSACAQNDLCVVVVAQEWRGLEPAMEWLLERNNNAGGTGVYASEVQSSTRATDHAMQPSGSQQSEEVKMVIAVRKDLGMGRGKVAAQGRSPTQGIVIVASLAFAKGPFSGFDGAQSHMLRLIYIVF